MTESQKDGEVTLYAPVISWQGHKIVINMYTHVHVCMYHKVHILHTNNVAN